MADETGHGRGSRDGVRVGVGVMARAPSSGGKSRLAPHLSAGRRLALRRALLADTLRTLTSVPAGDLRPRRQPPSPPGTSVPPGGDGGSVTVFVEPADACPEVEALSAGTIACVPQTAGDLGRRMCAAFDHLLQKLKYDAAVLVGSDIPLLTADHIVEACDTLTTARGIVIGPADDGGYYLIGMKAVHAELFTGVEWGTASVLTDTLRIAERAGFEARLIRAAYDLDTIQDLRRLEGDLRVAPPDVAPHVRAWFRTEGEG